MDRFFFVDEAGFRFTMPGLRMKSAMSSSSNVVSAQKRRRRKCHKPHSPVIAARIASKMNVRYVPRLGTNTKLGKNVPMKLPSVDTA